MKRTAVLSNPLSSLSKIGVPRVSTPCYEVQSVVRLSPVHPRHLKFSRSSAPARIAPAGCGCGVGSSHARAQDAELLSSLCTSMPICSMAGLHLRGSRPRDHCGASATTRGGGQPLHPIYPLGPV